MSNELEANKEIENLKLQLKQMHAAKLASDQMYNTAVRECHQAKAELFILNDQLNERLQSESKLLAEVKKLKDDVKPDVVKPELKDVASC